jgi:hypothetical protein
MNVTLKFEAKSDSNTMNRNYIERRAKFGAYLFLYLILADLKIMP